MAREGANGSFLFLENELGEYLFQIMGRNYPNDGQIFGLGGRENPGEAPQETAARETAQESGLIVSPHNIRWFGAAAQAPKGQAFLNYATEYEGVMRTDADREIAKRLWMSPLVLQRNRHKVHRPALYLFILFLRWKRGLEPTPCTGRISKSIVWPHIDEEEPFVLPAKGP